MSAPLSIKESTHSSNRQKRKAKANCCASDAFELNGKYDRSMDRRPMLQFRQQCDLRGGGRRDFFSTLIHGLAGVVLTQIAEIFGRRMIGFWVPAMHLC